MISTTKAPPPPSEFRDEHGPRFTDASLRCARLVMVENVAGAAAAGEHIDDLPGKLAALSFETDPAVRVAAWEVLVDAVERRESLRNGDFDMTTVDPYLRDELILDSLFDCLVGEAAKALVGGRS